MDLRTMIDAGETLTVEFKRQANDKDLVRAATCLANGEGGTLLIGVDDDGMIRGAAPRHGDRTDPHRLAALIQNSTEPALAVEIHLDVIDGHHVIAIQVPPADPGPVATKDGVYVKRVLDATGKPACLPMMPHEIVSIGMITRGQDYATTEAIGADMADLDPDEFHRFRRLCRATGDSAANLSDIDILVALGLVSRSHPISLGGILLFGREASIRRWVPTAEFLFQDLRRGDAAANLRLVGPLLRIAEELRELVDARNTVTELLVGMNRVEVSLITPVTRREAIANALVHRDYSHLGPTRVQMTESEFIVSNPGGFPPGVTPANILDQSRPRSPVLADAFRRAGLVERKGKGVNDMFEQQLRAGRDTPNYVRSTPDSVTVTVPLGTADLDLVRFLLTYENDHQRALALDDLRIVHEVKASGSATSRELASALDILPDVIRNAGARLVEAGILEARGTGRSRKFHLTARFYDLAQDRSAYVRIKGIDPLQQERMILDYVKAYGSITRGQAAALCQVAPVEARAVLKRLVSEELLVLRGERRGAHYVAADTP